MFFDPDKLYATDDPALLVLGPYSTLADWRSQKIGPPFHKFGKRVLYSGKDLYDWVAAHRVETVDPATRIRAGNADFAA